MKHLWRALFFVLVLGVFMPSRSAAQGITQTGGGQGAGLQLGQNYPNPAYQNTSIIYRVAVKSKVELVLFDIQGRPIKVMVNEMKASGTHSYILDTKNIAKGMYYYRMHSGNFLDAKKLIVQ